MYIIILNTNTFLKEKCMLMKLSPFTSDTCAIEDVERGAEVTFFAARPLLGPLKFRQDRQKS